MPTFRNIMLKKVSGFKRTDDDDNVMHPRFKRKLETDRTPYARRKTGGHRKRGSMAAHVKAPAMYARRVTIKTRFVRMNYGGKDSFRLHLKYIEREGVEKDGSKGILYSQNDEFDRNHFAREIKGEPHSFRLIVSPEDADEIDLTKFTQKFMRQVEKDLGRGLEWTAANHYNTDNPHVHIIIRGVDKNRNELRINSEYISHGMRNRASEIITRELGLRTDLEIRSQISKEVTAERFTGIDSQIDRQVDDSIFDLGPYPVNPYERKRQSQIISRLNKLESLGLASRLNLRQWKISDGWKGHLKRLSERNDIIKTMSRAVGGNPGRYFIINHKSESKDIEGRIHKGLVDELYDKYYTIVETVKGDSYYFRIDRNTMESFDDESIVSVSVKKDSWVKASDNNIFIEAQKNGGYYNRTEHEKSIRTSTIHIGEKEINKSEYLDAHEARLEKLSRLHLVERMPDAKWRIPDNLIEELQQKDISDPQTKYSFKSISKLSVNDQIRHRGQAWLDQYNDNPEDHDLAKHGFGAEVSKAARLRAIFLTEELGIDLLSNNWTERLKGIEHDNLELSKRNQGRQL
jgi:type IV secretory pathway VirD2 relaxase